MNPQLVDLATSTLASFARRWRGSAGSRQVVQPEQLPELFDREDDPACRLVREALTELNLDVLVYPCPQGGERYRQRLLAVAGPDASVPCLVDPNTNAVVQGAEAILSYLFMTYAGKPVPAALDETRFNLLSSQVASWLRPRLQARPSRQAGQPLTLYSFESSPYSRPVRERLCELQLAYRLVNLGKQQIADVGPAKFRLHLGAYQPLPDTKRARMLAQKGQVQVPFLIDAENQLEMFESADILAYLERTYAQ